MQQTEHYQLNQWELSDRIRMEDFNADNAKIAAALAGLERRIELLDRAAAKTAYYLGEVALRHLYTNGKYSNQRAMIVECFQYPTYYTLSGNITLENKILTLPGVGNTGHIDLKATYLRDGDWSLAIMWVHQLHAKVTPILNSQPMAQISETLGNASSGASTTETTYQLNCQGSRSPTISLDIECISGDAAQLYDLAVFFF